MNTFLRVLFTILTTASWFAQTAVADEALRERVASGLSEQGGWHRTRAELIALKLETSFALHDAVGRLDSRLKNLRLLAGNIPAQDLAVRHPGYLDAFLLDPDGYLKAVRRVNGDRIREESVLTALLRRPTKEGLKDAQFLLQSYGEDIARLASAPGFLDFFEALSWVGDDAPLELKQWLGRRLKEVRPRDLESMTSLFVLHRIPLRDRRNLSDLEDGWNALQRSRNSNPALANLLLEHRNIWRILQAPNFVDAMEVQVQHDMDRAKAVLIFVLGQAGALYVVPDLPNWSDALPAEHLPVAFELIADNDEAMMAAMFYWRDDPAFWSFIADRNKRAHLTCLLRKSDLDPGGLSMWWSWEESALANICRSEPSFLVRSIPLYSVYQVSNKLIDGVPLGWGDAADIGLESMSVLAVAKAAGLFGRSGFKAIQLAQEAGSPVASTVVTSSRRATTDTTTAMVRKIIADRISADARQQASSSPVRGFSRALGVSTSTVVRSISAKPDAHPAMVLAMEHGMNASGELAVEHALSTEFFRCATLAVQGSEDPICTSLSEVLTK